MLPYFQTSILPIYFFDQSVIILVLYNDFNYYPNSCSLFSKIFCVPACYSCFFFCFALIFSPQNYLLALQYFVLFSNCLLLCLLSNNFDCSQIVFGWVCSAIFFLFSNIFGWVCSPIFLLFSNIFLAGSALQHFLLFLNIFWLSNIFHCSQIFFGWVCYPIFFTVLEYLWLGLPVVAEVRLSPLERYRIACFAQRGNRNTFHNNGRPKQKQSRFR